MSFTRFLFFDSFCSICFLGNLYLLLFASPSAFLPSSAFFWREGAHTTCKTRAHLRQIVSSKGCCVRQTPVRLGTRARVAQHFLIFIDF
ncbi:uncharacterized protein B0H64DRAFT_122626 [Chaetomium fimeti]|uniref:Uncharacterized protein n=1 Tax=Chaetomium fimeti TaxID=1854472 RepID=A0AAE0HJF5_9PEZI|nr:hypothetical protein B0H64DRAFT_122626 [Chaetomium fimeti]